MQIPTKTRSQNPLMPAPLMLPLKILPAFVHNKILLTTLNRLFKQDIEEGELDFLDGKIIHILVEDASIEYCFTLRNSKLVAASNKSAADLILRGTIYNYLLLASREEDTDTLFFSRRLHMQGDTELGLYVKNFLDGMDMDSHKVPAYLEKLLKKSLPVYKKLFVRK